MSKTSYKNWSLKTDNDQILWLTFDKENASANTFNSAVISELDSILDDLAKDKEHKAVIITSAKKSGYIAGADIEEFSKFKTVDEAVAFIRKGQKVFNKLEALSMPTIAMIEGFCLGGGCEMALACTYRIAEEGPKTRIGLPEVKLGIHPGWGGSVRLPRLIGALKAMDIILAGRAVSAKVAKRMGFVDAAVPKRQLIRAARFYALKKPAPHKASLLESLTNSALIRPMLAQVFAKKVGQKISKNHYPAPFAQIDTWRKHGIDGDRAMMGEAKSIGRLLLDSTAKNLVRIFFMQEQMKGLAKGSKFKPAHVHVIGAGVMGGDIAAWCALKGLRVTLQDRESKFIAPAIKRAHKLYKKKLRKPNLVQAAMDRLQPDIEGTGIGKADVIIEAIFENLEAKKTLFVSLEKQMKAGAVLASNTSSIPLNEISQGLKDPSKLVGIHFFNPVAMMPLVEVVKSDKSDAKVVENAIAFVVKIGRLPLPVKSSPGFLVNRVLMPYLLEAMALFEEGVPGVVIDKAATDFGMPMGPIELADTVGLDVCLSVAKILTGHYGGTVPNRFQEMVDSGQLGRKTGQGFYRYNKGKVEKPKVDSLKDLLHPQISNESRKHFLAQCGGH